MIITLNGTNYDADLMESTIQDDTMQLAGKTPSAEYAPNLKNAPENLHLLTDGALGMGDIGTATAGKKAP